MPSRFPSTRPRRSLLIAPSMALNRPGYSRHPAGETCNTARIELRIIIFVSLFVILVDSRFNELCHFSQGYLSLIKVVVAVISPFDPFQLVIQAALSNMPRYANGCQQTATGSA